MNNISESMDNYKLITTINGSDIIGLEYENLFPFFEGKENAFKIFDGSFVSTEDGTGIVHIAPDFGEEDYNLCKENSISILNPIDDAGCFIIKDALEYNLANKSSVLNLYGKNVLDSNDEIIKYLKAKNLWLFTEDYIHNYPHCWRTDTPLIYRAISSWSVSVEEIKDKLIKINQTINWMPNHIKDGQFGKWLEGARDWSISRNRFWGCPIPIWKSENPNNKELYVFGSVKEIEDFFNCKIEDLHKESLDKLTKTDPYDSNFLIRRIPEVLDCWFESGCMPFASVHYPFENKEWFENNFPADFIVEYIAQTRGWFYTLLVISTALFDLPAFKNVICHGVILDAKGEKLSKRLRNYPDPFDIFEKLGSDTMRWSLLKSSIIFGDDLKIDKEGDLFLNTFQKFIKPIDNALNFYLLYKNSDNIKVESFSIEELIDDDFYLDNLKNEFDIYIINLLKKFSREFVYAMDEYNVNYVCNLSENFIENLNNWYIRRNKDRFWKKEKDLDKLEAYQTLRNVLYTFAVLTAPLLPFKSEELSLKLI